MEIFSEEIGLVILGLLCEFDFIVYLRFVSVYLNYNIIEDFVIEIDWLCDEFFDKMKFLSCKWFLK